MTQTYGQYAVKGAATPFVTYRTDWRVGRINFTFRNFGDNTVKIQIQEFEVDGTYPKLLFDGSSSPIVNGGGTLEVSVNSAKGQVQLLSSSGNTANSNVYVTADFMGMSFYGGNLADMESLNRSGFFTGTDIPGGIRD